MRKGVLPSEYIDGWGRIKETKFPKRRCFYSSIRDENVTREDSREREAYCAEGPTVRCVCVDV
jgi:hypothetical protein